MDFGETVTDAAIRETWEETGLSVSLTGLLNVYSYPGSPVIIVYRARRHRRHAHPLRRERPPGVGDARRDPLADSSPSTPPAKPSANGWAPTASPRVAEEHLAGGE